MLEFISGMVLVPVLKYLLAHRIGNWIDKKIDENPVRFERPIAILNHYKTGHPSDSVLGCGQGDCRIFAG